MPTGVLLLHGFAGSRREIAPLREYLTQSGFIVSAPILSGHESTRKNLAQAKCSDWIKSAAEAAAELKKSCDSLIMIGFSMGGLVAVNLCQDMDINRLILINTPVYYWDVKRIARNLVNDFKKYSKKYFIASTDKPLPALLQFLKILRKTKPLFSCINCPIFIIQTLDDDTVNCKSADYIYRRVKGDRVIKKYKEGGHLLFETDVAQDVCFEIGSFMHSSVHNLHSQWNMC